MNTSTTPTRDASLPEMVGDDEVCRAIRRTPQTIRNLVRNGELPTPVVLGRKRYWPRETIASFLRGEINQPEKLPA